MNPYLILNVSETAQDKEIKNAYLKTTHEYPPEHHPEMFEAVRIAYETIGTERQRLKYQLFNVAPPDRMTLIYACLTDQEHKELPFNIFNQIVLEGIHSAIQENLENL